MTYFLVSVAVIFGFSVPNSTSFAEAKSKKSSAKNDLLERLSGTWKTGCRKDGACGTSCKTWASETFLTLTKNGSFTVHVSKDCDYDRRDLSLIVETCRGTFSAVALKTKVKIRDTFSTDPFNLIFKHKCKPTTNTIPGADERFPLMQETMGFYEGNLWFVNENLYGTRGPLYPYAVAVANDEKPGIQIIYPSPPWLSSLAK